MSDENKHIRIPQLRTKGIAMWLEEFKACLMGWKSSQLALEQKRPEEDPIEIQYHTPVPPMATTALDNYKAGIKKDQIMWDERNDRVKSLLVQATSSTENTEARQLIMESIREGKTSKEICDALVARFFSTDSRIVNVAIAEMSSLKAASGEKATSFITRLLESKEELRQMGKIYSNGEMVGRLMDGLKDSPDYAMIIATFETIKDLRFEDAIEQLRTKDRRTNIDKPPTETAAFAQGTNDSQHQQRDRNKTNCQICRKPGHSASTCHYRYSGQKTNKKNGPQNTKNSDKKHHIRCFKCGKKGHYASDCRTKKGNTSVNSEEKTEAPDPKRQKTGTSGHSNWDDEHFSGMLNEQEEDKNM
jgi:hypothetical protein